MNARWASLPLPFLAKPRFGIRRALMGGVRTPLAMEVDARVARIVGRLSRRRLVFGTQALEAGRRFDQRAVDREMLIAQQSQPIRLGHHRVEETAGRLCARAAARGSWRRWTARSSARPRSSPETTENRR